MSRRVICAGDTFPSTAPKLIIAAPAANAASISSGRFSLMYDLIRQHKHFNDVQT